MRFFLTFSGKNLFLQEIKPFNYKIPGDISSASFFIVLTLLSRKSSLIIKNVNTNPSRIGIIKILNIMGAKIKFLNKKKYKGEKISDIYVKSNKNLKGEHVGAFLVFDTQENGEVLAKVSSSFISHAQASINLKREIPENISFDQLVEEGKLVWNNELSKIKVASKESEKTNEDLIKFYSSLYRTILFPRQFHEYDLDNNQIHYSPYDGNIYDGPLYTDNGFWDTFRAVFPFYSLV